MSVTETQGIRISVRTRYEESESDPQQEQWIFSYQVTLENEGDSPAQLIARHWTIRDAVSRVEEVRGEGVVGQMPRLKPGERFIYNSWCPLGTESGIMRGAYTMQRENGEQFEAVVAPFVLSTPALLN